MGPKPKAQKSEWSECLQCYRTVSSKDLQKHVKVCKNDESDGEVHGFVKSGVLYGLVSDWVPLDAEEKWPKSSKNNLLQMSPCTMRICNISIGSLIVVNDRHVMKGWPVSSVHPACVGLSEQSQRQIGAKSGDMLTVEPFVGPYVPAKSISVAPRCYKDFMSSQSFQSFLLRSCDDKYLTTSCNLTLKYYGQECQFIVTEIAGCDGDTILLSKDSLVWMEDGANQCVEDLSKLTLDESLNQSEIDLKNVQTGNCMTPPRLTSDKQNISTSTPVKNDLSSPTSNESFNKSDLFRTPLSTKHKRSDSRTKFYYICNETHVNVVGSASEKKQSKPTVTYESIGGLDTQIQQIKEMIDLPLSQPELFSSYGLPPPRGVLLYGPSGTGKTLLSQAVSSQCNCTVMHVNGPEIWSKFYGETEGRLKSIFKEAAERAPSLIVIDQLDTVCPKRDTSQNEVEKRVVASFLTFMDGLDTTTSKGHVMVLASTNKPDNVDPALRRPGRFDREIETGVPSAKQRGQILSALLQSANCSLSADEVQSIADKCHGFVGADLSALCKEAGMHVIRSSQPGSVPCIQARNLEAALSKVKPSAMREVAIDVPKVLWSDIGGQAELKQKLKQAVEWPLKHPEAFQRLGIRPPRGVLMYGPPGCSKTMIAKALATESRLNFISIKGPELFSKWVGESERAVREVFRKARSAAPSIVFFDEIDALAVERGSSSGGSSVADRVLAQLLTEMDGVESLQDVTIVAATNRPDMIDKALLRPGRLDRIVYVPLPDVFTRREIFQILMKKMPVGDDVSLDDLVLRTKKYSGAEVAAVCNEAALSCLQEDITAQFIMARHFDQALMTVTPRIGDETIKFYEGYQQKSGLHQV